MRVAFRNTSPLSRTAWATVTVPSTGHGLGAEATFLSVTGDRHRAVRGRQRGNVVAYRVWLPILGGARVYGDLVPEPHKDAGITFEAHPWVADDVGALLPGLEVDFHGAGRADPLVMLESSPAHQRWWMRRKVRQAGVVFEWWADIRHQDPVVSIWGKIIWSDRRAPEQRKRIFQAALHSGEYVSIDDATRMGIPSAFSQSGKWIRPLWTAGADPVFKDGSGLAFSGSMLCAPKERQGKLDPADLAPREVRWLEAALHGPVVGVATNAWGGQFLANENIPNMDTSTRAEFAYRQDRRESKIPGNRPFTVAGEYGLGADPSQTGEQWDFGATKGTYAFREPGHIPMMGQSVYREVLRGCHHYEADGTPLDVYRHPDWVTWSGRTHWHTGVSPDRLGKSGTEGDLPISYGQDWKGYDDEHRSQNALAAYMTLADDPLAEDILRHQVTTDEAAYAVRRPGYVWAPRAVGRTAQALAQLATAADRQTAERLYRVIEDRLADAAKAPGLRVKGVMKVLEWRNPDPRKPVYDQHGELAPWTSMWEHGLAAVGLYAVVKGTGDPKAVEILRKISNTLLRWGWCRDPRTGAVKWVDDMAWLGDGTPPGAVEWGSIGTPKPRVTVGSGRAGTSKWTFAGILAAREFLGWKDPELDRAVALVTGNGLTTNIIEAEWWATARDVL